MDTYDQLLDMGFTEEEIENIMGLIAVQEQEANLPSDVQFAQKGIRDFRTMPEGRQTGDLFTAADPLEFLAAALGTGIQEGKRAGARTKQEEAAREKARLRLAALGKGRSRSMAPAPGTLSQNIRPQDVVLNSPGGVAPSLYDPFTTAAMQARLR